ncbi:MAG: hypothetical protein GY931_06160 [Maribacter sp.]|nr:hypothetical protein [Maribacter sp.]
MNLKIFKDLTTDDYLNDLDAESKKYKGLYVEMNNAPERKYVKEKASSIEGLRKRIERARIDKASEYKNAINEEAGLIDERLDKANRPFLDLIEAHKEERAKILAKEKADREAKELALQIGLDHEDAINYDKLRTFEINEKLEADRKLEDERKKEQEEREKRIADEARAQAEREAEEAKEAAKQAEIDKINAQKAAEQQKIEAEEAAKQAEIDRKKAIKKAAEHARQAEINRQEEIAKLQQEEQVKRESNKKHIGNIRRESKECLMDFVDEEIARKIVLAISKCEIKNVTINY